MKGRFRHIVVWKVLRPIIGPVLKYKFSYEPEAATLPGPCLILSNHTTNRDPLLLGLSFKEQIYFVASEHIFRWGFLSRLIVWLQSPIPRLKGSAGTDAAAGVIRRLRKGCNVCLFIEGDCSWSGRTAGISPTAAKLVRAGGATLVTYKFTGGYFTEPRWASKPRRGKMRGGVIGIYSPEDMAKMSPDSIGKHIRDDLSEDAYERQRRAPCEFKGKNLAQHLETALFMCPVCSAVGTLSCKGNELRCTCGLRAVYNNLGFLVGPGLPFDSVAEWDDWQISRLSRLFELAGDGPIFEDNEVTLNEICPGHRTRRVNIGRISFFREKIICAGAEFPVASVGGMAVHGSNTIDISAGSKNFEITGGKVFCGRKYLLMYNFLKNNPTVPAK